jgi:amino acid transporter
MRTFINLLSATLLLSIMQYFAVSLVIVLAILLLMSAIVHPRKTLQLVAALGLTTVALREPSVCAAALGSVGVAAVVAHYMRLRRKSPLTPPALLPSPATA